MDLTPENFNEMVRQIQRLNQDREATNQAYNELTRQFQDLNTSLQQARDLIDRLQKNNDGKN